MNTLFVDSNFLAWETHYALARTMPAETREMAVAWGFLERVLGLGEMFKTNRFVFCFDQDPWRRRKLLPTYKAARRAATQEKTPEEQQALAWARAQIEMLRTDVLRDLGFSNVFWTDGCEADDQLAAQSAGLVARAEPSIIVSADEDLLQCLCHPHRRVWSPPRRKLWTAEMLRDERGVFPCQWADVKALAGCSSDGVPGVGGRVGEKTAVKWLRGERVPSAARDAIERAKWDEMYDRNKRLVTLPFPGTIVFPHRPDTLSMAAVEDMARRSSFTSWLERPERWQRFIAGDFASVVTGFATGRGYNRAGAADKMRARKREQRGGGFTKCLQG